MRLIPFLIITLVLSSACESNTSQKIKTNTKLENIEVRKLANNHWQTYTDIKIDAPVEKVWEVLSDWDHLSDWSSSLIKMEGDIQDKGKVRVTYLVDGNTYESEHIFIYKEREEFGWSDLMEGSFKGLTDNHRFRVERISENQTRFIQSDDFNGVGIENMSAEKVANSTVKFFPIFNRELKMEVEKKSKD